MSNNINGMDALKLNETASLCTQLHITHMPHRHTASRSLHLATKERKSNFREISSTFIWIHDEIHTESVRERE